MFLCGSMEMETVREISKLFVISLFFVIVSFCVGCEPQEKYERSVDLLKPAGNSNVLEAKTVNGDIVYNGNETGDCRVIAKIQARANTQEIAQKLAEETKVSLEEADNKIIVKIEKPDTNCNRNVSVSLDIAGPKQMAVVFVSCNGDIKANQIAGSLSFTTTNGDMEACDIGGDVNVQSCNGDIELSRVNKNITAKTSNGDIEVCNAKGNCNFASNNGDIELSYETGATEVTNIVLVTNNGDIDLKAPGWSSGSIELSTGNGDIESQGLLQFHGRLKGTGKWVIGDASTENSLKIVTTNGDIKIY